jgi:hypothetical protein
VGPGGAARRTPLWRLLGGRHDTLPTYNTDGGWLNFSPDELIDDMSSMADAGWTWLKMKVGLPDLSADLDRLAKVRAHLPDDVLLSVDVNQKWDLHRARTAVRALGDLGIQWLEEPVHPDAVQRTASWRGRARSDRPGRERLQRGGVRDLLPADAVDVVQVDVTRVAGVTEWLRIAHSAQSKGRWVVPHAGDMMQVHQHLVAGISTAPRPMIEYLPWGLDVFAEPVRMTARPSACPRHRGLDRHRPQAQTCVGFQPVGPPHHTALARSQTEAQHARSTTAPRSARHGAHPRHRLHRSGGDDDGDSGAGSPPPTAGSSLAEGVAGKKVSFIIYAPPATPFFEPVVAGAKDAAKAYGLDLDIQYSNSDVATQNNQINTALAAGVDALALSVASDDAFTDSVCAAQEQGVPVVAFNVTASTVPSWTACSPSSGRTSSRPVRSSRNG